jgi:hypothetical protein
MEGNAHFCRGLLATRYDDGRRRHDRNSPTPERGATMKAVQVVGYHTKLQLTDIPEPTIEGRWT